MYCTKCGAQNSEDAKFCLNCGTSLNQTTSTPPPNQPMPSPASINVQKAIPLRRTSGLAVASLVLGILGFSILAIIFGAVAIGQTGQNQNLSGRGMAIAGLVLGILWLAIDLLVLLIIVGVVSLL